MIFFHDWSLNTLKKYLDKRTDNNLALFVSHPKGKKPERWRDKRVRQYLTLLNEETGIYVTAHKLRRTAATHFRQNGGDIHDIQHFLGHSKITTTTFYLGVNWDKIQKAHEKFIHYGNLTSSGFNGNITTKLYYYAKKKTTTGSGGQKSS